MLIIAWVVMNQRRDAVALVGIAYITAGVLITNRGSTVAVE